jgi:hypothetical protein
VNEEGIVGPSVSVRLSHFPYDVGKPYNRGIVFPFIDIFIVIFLPLVVLRSAFNPISVAILVPIVLYYYLSYRHFSRYFIPIVILILVVTVCSP